MPQDENAVKSGLTNKSSDDNSFQDVTEMNDPGELAPVEGMSYEQAKELWDDNLSKLPKHYQNILHDLVQDITMNDMWPRLDETYRCTQQQFYTIDEFDHAYNADDNSWDRVPYNGNLSAGMGGADDVDHPTSSYPINIYKAYMNGFIQTIANGIPGTKFLPKDTGDTQDVDAAAQAERMKKCIEQSNNMLDQIRDYARIFWTDGRLAIYNRFVIDGARFGYYDEEEVDEEEGGMEEDGTPAPKKPRKARGGVVSTAYGVNEVRVPINMDRQEDFQYIQLALEVDEYEAKGIYPNKAQAIQPGVTGPGEAMRDRTFRIAVRQGTRIMTENADSIAKLTTWTRTWIRPNRFLSLSEDDRDFLLAVFPDGCFVAFMGDTYCESRNECMDDHWVIRWPNSSPGSSRRSVGQPLVPIQDACIDITDLRMSCYMNLIPTVLIDEQLLSGESLSQQRAEYGTFVTVTRPDAGTAQQTALADGVFIIEVPTIPSDLQQFHKDLITDIPAFLTGLFAAALGGSDPNNETAAGIGILAGKSRGQQTPYYKQLCDAYAKSLLLCVRIAAKFLPDDEEINMTAAPTGTSNSDKAESITVDLEELRDGQYVCFPETGDSIPESFDDKAQRVQEWMADAETNPFIAQQLQDPANQETVNKYLGMSDFKITGQDARQQQLRVISLLLEETPMPSPQRQQHIQRSKQAIQMGVQGGLKPEEAMSAVAPFPPDQPADQASWPGDDKIAQLIFKNQDHAIAITTTKGWITSEDGWEAAQDNPQGFQNVCLNLDAHTAAAKAGVDEQAGNAAQILQGQETIKAKAKAAGEVSVAQGKALIEKSSADGVAVNIKDLGPAARGQVLAKRGIDATPDLIGEANEAAASPDGTPEGPDDSAIAKTEQ